MPQTPHAVGHAECAGCYNLPQSPLGVPAPPSGVQGLGCIVPLNMALGIL